jgi:hypothetical protein
MLLALEVGDSPGFDSARRIDAVGFSLASPFEFEGYELKASRGDALRELRQPSKVLPFSGTCMRLYLVTPKAVLMPVEVPEPWGLLELHGMRLVTAKEPGATFANGTVTTAFLAAWLNRLVMSGGLAVTRHQLEKSYWRGRQSKDFWCTNLEPEPNPELAP